MKTLLVATDLSERAEPALRRGVLLAQQTSAALCVLYVVDQALPAPLVADHNDAARKLIAASLADIPGTDALQSNIVIVSGDPAQDISAQAVAIDADMVIVGRHRKRGFLGFFNGTTVERLARQIACPLLVVSRPAQVPYDKAVVGVDFSPCAARAVRLAANLVGAGGLSLLHCYRVPFKGLTGHPSHSPTPDARGVNRALAAWLRDSDLPDDIDSALAQEGSAINLLPQKAARVGADLICLGAHSRSWVAETVLGSTAAELMSYSDLDILIVPLASTMEE